MMEIVGVVGLGYVGLPLALVFEKNYVIGFDTNSAKVYSYLDGHDPTGEVGNEAVENPA